MPQTRTVYPVGDSEPIHQTNHKEISVCLQEKVYGRQVVIFQTQPFFGMPRGLVFSNSGRLRIQPVGLSWLQSMVLITICG